MDGLETSGSFTTQKPPYKQSALESFSRRLIDFEQFRLPEMDQYGVDVQVLSLTAPGLQVQPDSVAAIRDARLANDYLAEIVAQHPTRFEGFAALPLQDPSAAAHELRRAVQELGFRGALVNDHTLGHYLDERAYEPLWEMLEELDVPLYLHPGEISSEAMRLLPGRPELLGPTFSWTVTTGGHAMRIIYGGVFDKFPKAKLILGHMGEFLPFQLARFDTRHHDIEMETPLKRLPSEYFGSNIKITTTGVHSPSALTAAIEAIGIDNVMFSVDYPYESTEQAINFLKSANLNPDDLDKVAHGNADRLLRLDESPKHLRSSSVGE